MTAAPSIPTQSVLEGVTIMGKTGTMPNMAVRNPNGMGAGRSQALEWWTGGGSGIFLKPQKGYYDGVDTWTYYNEPNLVQGNIISGKSIFGVAGSIPNKTGSSTVITPKTVNQAIPQGYYDGAMGSGVVVGDSDLIPENIVSGKNIFGVNGTAPVGKKFASGTINTGYDYSTVTGLGFTPQYVLAHTQGAYNNSYWFYASWWPGYGGSAGPSMPVITGVGAGYFSLTTYNMTMDWIAIGD